MINNFYKNLSTNYFIIYEDIYYFSIDFYKF